MVSFWFLQLSLKMLNAKTSSSNISFLHRDTFQTCELQTSFSQLRVGRRNFQRQKFAMQNLAQMWWFIMSGSPEVYRLTSVKCSSLPKEARGSAHSWDINQTHLSSPTSGSSSAGWGEQRNTCLLVGELMGQLQISLLKFDVFNYKVAEEQKYFSALISNKLISSYRW